MTTLTDTQVVTASGGLVELGYTAVTSNTTVGGFNWLGVATTTVVADGSKLLVEFQSPYVSAAAQARLAIAGTNYRFGDLAAAGPFCQSFVITPPAGSVTVTVEFTAAGSSTINGSGGTYGAGSAFLRVSKIVQATQWPAVTTGTIICTSTTRPASPFVGQQIYEADTGSIQVWNGTAWSQVWPQLFVTASDTTIQTGAANSDFVYATATITLTPGVWLVQGSAVLFNTVTADAACVGLYNVTTAAEVTNSRGPNGTVTTGQALQLTSRLVQMSVSASTSVRVLCTRNGASTIRCGSSSGAPAAALWAQKVG